MILNHAVRFENLLRPPRLAAGYFTAFDSHRKARNRREWRQQIRRQSARSEKSFRTKFSDDSVRGTNFVNSNSRTSSVPCAAAH